MLIGILQTGHAPDPIQPDYGDYSDMFERLLGGQGFTFRTWNVVDMDFPTSTDAADGWLITGSRHGAYEDHPFIPPLEDTIRAIYGVLWPSDYRAGLGWPGGEIRRRLVRRAAGL